MTDKIYPLATADGRPIPLEVLNIYGWVSIAFNAVTGTAELALPAEAELLSLTADEDCIVTFGKVATVPANSTILTDAVEVPYDMRVSVVPQALTISVIGVEFPGTLKVQMSKSWAALSLPILNTRR